jgi:hypothetical protein
MTKVKKFLPIAKTEPTYTPEEDKNAQLYKHLKEPLPLITCNCGKEILLVPDIRAMDLAIKNHVAKHTKKSRNVQEKVNTSGNISQLLSQLTLTKISEIKST